jgi:hypothetical protein
MAAFASGRRLARVAPRAHNGPMRIESPGLAALLLSLGAVAACTGPWTKPAEKAFAENDARCLQLAMKASPINEARVIDCDADRSAVNCGSRAELKTTLKLPAPAESEAVREANLARHQAYSECMARSGS